MTVFVKLISYYCPAEFAESVKTISDYTFAIVDGYYICKSIGAAAWRLSRALKGSVKLLDDVVDEAEMLLLSKDIKYLPGPQLPSKITSTFEGSIYTNRKLISNERFYKYHGTNNRTGRKYAWYSNKKYSTELELRQKLAIRDDWGVQIKLVTEFNIPSGTWVSEGKAAAQGVGYPGKDYQAVITNTPNSWIIKTTKAF